MGEPEKREPVPTTPLEGVRAFTEEESEAIQEKRANLGDDMVAVMRDVDSAAYKEYQNISQEGNASGTREGMVAGFRYLHKWIQKKANENPSWLEEYKAAQKMKEAAKGKSSEPKLSKAAAAFLEKRQERVFRYFLTEELEKMAADEKYAKEKINAMKGAVRMSGQINEQFGQGSRNTAYGEKEPESGRRFDFSV